MSARRFIKTGAVVGAALFLTAAYMFVRPATLNDYLDTTASAVLPLFLADQTGNPGHFLGGWDDPALFIY
jgi:hypothetical protein